ncbi:protein N-terminal and lysine N-methyltransferase EFM7 [Diutina catenulata]
MSDDEFGGFFEEPEGFRPPPPAAHYASYDRKPEGGKPSTVKLRLVGSSPLWGHMLWNAGIYTADHLDAHPELVRGKRVLEVGAASGLPSLIASLNDASLVTCTDYPDPDLVANIEENFAMLREQAKLAPYSVQGYIWGQDVRPLVGREAEASSADDLTEEERYDLCILSDVVFNHTEHHALLSTCRKTLKKSGRALVVFSPHRPWLLEADLQFFETCEEHELKAEKIEMVNWKPMFDEDEETVEIRSRVYAYYLVPQWK